MSGYGFIRLWTWLLFLAVVGALAWAWTSVNSEQRIALTGGFALPLLPLSIAIFLQGTYAAKRNLRAVKAARILLGAAFVAALYGLWVVIFSPKGSVGLTMGFKFVLVAILPVVAICQFVIFQFLQREKTVGHLK